MFMVAPYLMLALGVYKFLISLYGFGITSSENRGLLAFFAVLLSIAFVAQVASIFLFWQVKTQVEIGGAGAAEANEEINKYGEPGYDSITNSWDHMQQHLHCCGVSNYNSGYRDWGNTKFGRGEGTEDKNLRNRVPDSCCHQENPNCGNRMLDSSAGGESSVREKIFVDGCLEILKHWMQEDIVPMIAVYSGVGIAIALVELIAVVLVSAYVAQISRRQQREEMMWNAVRGEDVDNRHHEMAPINASERTSNHDTQV